MCGPRLCQAGDALVGDGFIGPQYQGYSVSLSSAGSLLAVGGPFTQNGTGAVWMWENNGTKWNQMGGALLGTGFIGVYLFQGYSVSLSSNGSILAVGSPGNNDGIGAVCLFNRTSEYV